MKTSKKLSFVLENEETSETAEVTQISASDFAVDFTDEGGEKHSIVLPVAFAVSLGLVLRKIK